MSASTVAETLETIVAEARVHIHERLAFFLRVECACVISIYLRLVALKVSRDVT